MPDHEKGQFSVNGDETWRRPLLGDLVFEEKDIFIRLQNTTQGGFKQKIIMQCFEMNNGQKNLPR